MPSEQAKPTVILMRHGQIPQSEPRRFVGQRDLPLDLAGQEQADAAGRWLATLLAQGPRPECICCSDLARTRETARRVAQELNISPETIEPREELREIRLGAWEGLSKAEVQERFPGMLEQRGNDLANHRPHEGESFQDLQDRIFQVFKEIAAKTERLRIIVAHAGANRALLCKLLGMPLANVFSLEQDYCCVNILQQVQQRWMVRHLNVLPWTAGGVLV